MPAAQPHRGLAFQRHAHRAVQLPALIEQQRLVGHIARYRVLEEIDQPLQHLQPREIALLQQLNLLDQASSLS